GDRARQPAAALLDLAAVAARQQLDDRVVARVAAAENALETVLGADQALAYAVAQLARREDRERDQQQLLERDAAGDVARRQRRDRVRLAGAGARLEYGHAGRQLAADVELARRGDHSSLTCSCSHSPRHSRTA